MNRIVMASALALLVTATTLAAPAARTSTSSTALDDAFRIASAIASDPKDRAQAQESVVLDLAMLGRLDDAARLADDVEGWRRGVAHAEIAQMMARAGRIVDARALVAKAERVREETGSWEASRLDAHIARANVMLGEMSRREDVAQRLLDEDDQQYAGLPAIIRASARAAKGEIDAALKELAGTGTPAIEMAWWRTSAYIEISKSPRADADQRRRALESAHEAASAVAETISRVDSLEAVAGAFQQAGLGNRAEAVLGEAYAIVAKLPDSTVLKGPFLAGQARVWTRIGKAGRAIELLSQATAVAPKAANLDRPAIWANIAAGYRAAGDSVQAGKLLARALDEAEALANARPRALAAVEVCRAIARFDVPFEEGTRRRVAALLAGLKAPW